MNLPSKRMSGQDVVQRAGRALAPSGDEAPDQVGSYDPAQETPVPEHEEPSEIRQILATAAQLAVALIIIYVGTIIYGMIVESSPKAERAARERVARLVEVVEVAPATQGPMIAAWGEVRAAQTLVVRPEISGTLTWLHPEVTAGGRLKAGEVAARFDARDLELAVLQAESDIAEIEARIQLEEGQAALGERELTRLSRNITEAQRNLVLRKPQMAQLKAELASAKATLDQARNALERTEVRVPFDALVLEENVAPGAMITQGSEAATLVAADRFHVVLAVPSGALGWIDHAGGQAVRLTQDGIWPKGSYREGIIVRQAAAVSGTGRMAELIVEVTDPLATAPGSAGLPPLLLGSFVEAEVAGTPVEGAIALDRAHLRDDDTVWVMTPEDTLEVRTVEIAWRGPERVLVRAGLAAGERVVTTPLASFAPGMALRTGEPEVSG